MLVLALALGQGVALPQALTDSVDETVVEGDCEALGLPEAVDTCVEGAGVGLGVPVVHCDPALLAVGDWLCDSVALTEALAETVSEKGAEVATALGLPVPELQKDCDTVEEGEKLTVPLSEVVSEGGTLGVCKREPLAEALALVLGGGEEAAGERLGEELVPGL